MTTIKHTQQQVKTKQTKTTQKQTITKNKENSKTT